MSKTWESPTIGIPLKNIKVGIFVAIKINIALTTKAQNMNNFDY
jgi:hypothetical protein